MPFLGFTPARPLRIFYLQAEIQYHYLRECELEAALAQSRADVSAGRTVQESAQAHMDRLEAMLNPESPTSGV